MLFVSSPNTAVSALNIFRTCLGPRIGSKQRLVHFKGWGRLREIYYEIFICNMMHLLTINMNVPNNTQNTIKYNPHYNINILSLIKHSPIFKRPPPHYSNGLGRFHSFPLLPLPPPPHDLRGWAILHALNKLNR